MHAATDDSAGQTVCMVSANLHTCGCGADVLSILCVSAGICCCVCVYYTLKALFEVVGFTSIHVCWCGLG